ncbi:uncharacterized protein PAC_01109 [Phialocephala subalpina]|uniref:WW domain-containing protein n=1 Tax=Phialocephala subalpina TaxID=576137 RepID=A0A1L7WEN8_9HELO|nr:uncharacterized protein PAC_01109 [Phialocephala subalpina]
MVDAIGPESHSSIMVDSNSSSNSGRELQARPPRYEYVELDGNNIRLMTLLPGQATDPIRITISHASLIPPDHTSLPAILWTKEKLQQTLPEGWTVHRTLDETFLFENEKGTSWTHPDPAQDRAHYQLPGDYPYPNFEPKYEALSYFWGDPTKRDTIFVETPTETRSLGIGLNLAIALQHLRYEDTPRSLWIDAICINQEDLAERSSQVRRMAALYKMAYRVIVWLGPESADSKLALSTIANLGSQVECSEDISAYFPIPGREEPTLVWKDFIASLDEHWAALDHLLQRQWFSRLWVMQEIRLANRRAIVQCGGEQIKWSYFSRAFLSIWDQHLPQALRHRIHGTRKLMGKMAPLRVALLLSWSAYSHCSDPKDKVYAILGIVDPEFSRSIQPRYSSPKSQVYKDATVVYVELYQKLNLLQQCSISSWEVDLPTWVPNWSEIPSSTLFEERLNNASGLSVTEVHTFGFDKEHRLQLLAEKYRRRGSRYLTGENMVRAVVASLVGNRCFERQPDQHSLPHLDALVRLFLEEDSASGKGGSLALFPENIAHHVDRYKPGRVFFETMEGYVGIAPQGIQPDLDLICVLLGCNLPLVLRPTASGQFQVVGECHVHGLCDTEALLGPLSKEWTIEIQDASLEGTGWPTFVNIRTNMRTWQDPRLPPLPPEWEGIPHPELSSSSTGSLFYRFKSNVTAKTTKFDPRLSLKTLEERGAKLRKFQLI